VPRAQASSVSRALRFSQPHQPPTAARRAARRAPACDPVAFVCEVGGRARKVRAATGQASLIERRELGREALVGPRVELRVHLPPRAKKRE
jgi:hypothetical protein